MPLSVVFSRALTGMTAPIVMVEAHLSPGLVGLHLVGLPETAVKESKDRVRSAIINSNLEFPVKRITINLAPADLPKEGGRFDLPIAIGILAASNQLPSDRLTELEFCGELALSGEIRPIRGVLPMVLAARKSGRQLIVPLQNKAEASLVQGVDIYYAGHLLEICAFLQGKKELPLCQPVKHRPSAANALDLNEVRGQFHAKRALEIAAAGRHSLLLAGPPGTGKTMLANRITGLLPLLTDDEALEVASVASICHQGFDASAWKQRPFRSPHHTSSSVALVGGGRPPRPGEISLAHRGILFLDELPEFNRQVLECLREPLESGKITISRAATQATFPADFQLIAAMNPCPCGYAGVKDREECHCSPEQIKRYTLKISGPLLDRMDMHVEVARVLHTELIQHQGGESSAQVRERVMKARAFQWQRQGKYNQALSVAELEKYGQLDEKGEQLMTKMMAKFKLSARAYHRILKVGRTIADLAECTTIQPGHLSEALACRCFDRQKSKYA